MLTDFRRSFSVSYSKIILPVITCDNIPTHLLSRQYVSFVREQLWGQDQPFHRQSCDGKYSITLGLLESATRTVSQAVARPDVEFVPYQHWHKSAQYILYTFNFHQKQYSDKHDKHLKFVGEMKMSSELPWFDFQIERNKTHQRIFTRPTSSEFVDF